MKLVILKNKESIVPAAALLILLFIPFILTGDSSAIPFFFFIAVFIIPGWFLSRRLNPDIQTGDPTHIVTGFALSFFMLAPIGLPALFFHLSSSLAFIGMLILWFIATVILIYLEFKNPVQSEEPETKPGTGFIEGLSPRIYLLSLASLIIITVFWFLRNRITGEQIRIQLTIAGVFITVFALVSFLVNRKQPLIVSPSIKPTRSVNVAAGIVLALLVLFHLWLNTQTTFYSPDHVYYQSNIVDFQDSDALNMYESSFGEDFKPFSFYSFPLWDLFISGLVRLSGCNPFIAFHKFIPLLAILLSYLAAWTVLKAVDRRLGKHALLILVVFAVLNLFSGSKLLGYGFGIQRAANCKAIIMNIIFPLIFAFYLRWLEKKDSKGLILLTMLLTTGVSIHIMTVPLVAVLFAAGGISLLVNEGFKKSIKQILLHIVPAIIPALIMAGIFLRMADDYYFVEAGGTVARSFLPGELLANAEFLFYLTIVAILLPMLLKTLRGMLYSLIALFLLIALVIPGAQQIVFMIMSPPIAQRIISVPQIYLLLGIWIVLPLIYNSGKKRWALTLSSFTAALLVVFLIIQPGGYELNGKNIHQFQNKYKVADEYITILDYYSAVPTDEERAVIAPYDVSKFIPAVHGKSRMYISRWYYTYHYLGDEARVRNDLLQYLYNLNPEQRISRETLDYILDDFRASDLVLDKGNKFFAEYSTDLESLGFKIEATGDKYSIFHRPNRLFDKKTNNTKTENDSPFFEYFEKYEIPKGKTGNICINSGDFNDFAFFGDGWSEIIRHPLRKTVRLAENSAEIYMNLIGGKRYVIDAWMITSYFKIQNPDASCRLVINGKDAGELPINRMGHKFERYRFIISKELIKDGVNKIEFHFNFFKVDKKDVIIREQQHFSCHISKICMTALDGKKE
ncbi:MAG: hypothetical protein JW737_08275 [Acidobacteria bacterium]|nr:hypothetical protein [Acidobacteriota bacterium]